MSTSFKDLKLYYICDVLGSTHKGRGENVRLMLEDAGLDYEYIRHQYEEWPDRQKELLDQNIPNPTMPYITVNGKYYGKVLPVMRFIAKKLGKYEGANDDENQLTDAYTDMVVDWLNDWVQVAFGDDKKKEYETYRSDYVPQIHKTWNDVLSRSKGPYLLGDRITYADFHLYHMLEDDNEAKIDAETYPYLATFVGTIQARPNLSKYLATDRK